MSYLVRRKIKYAHMQNVAENTFMLWFAIIRLVLPTAPQRYLSCMGAGSGLKGTGRLYISFQKNIYLLYLTCVKHTFWYPETREMQNFSFHGMWLAGWRPRVAGRVLVRDQDTHIETVSTCLPSPNLLYMFCPWTTCIWKCLTILTNVLPPF